MTKHIIIIIILICVLAVSATISAHAEKTKVIPIIIMTNKYIIKQVATPTQDIVPEIYLGETATPTCFIATPTTPVYNNGGNNQ